MDGILQLLFSWQFIFFALAVAAVMYVIRLFVEYFLNLSKVDIKKSKLWNDLIMPILPVLIGAFGSVFLKAFPYPDGLTTKGDRIVFGLVAGLLSTVIYRVVKALLYQKIVAALQPAPASASVTSTNIDTTAATVVATVNPTDKIPADQLPQRGQI